MRRGRRGSGCTSSSRSLRHDGIIWGTSRRKVDENWGKSCELKNRAGRQGINSKKDGAAGRRLLLAAVLLTDHRVPPPSARCGDDVDCRRFLGRVVETQKGQVGKGRVVVGGFRRGGGGGGHAAGNVRRCWLMRSEEEEATKQVR